MKTRVGITMESLGVVLALAVLSACATPGIREANLRKAARALDRIERNVDEWGTASISELLLMENKEQFKIDYSQSISDYVAHARSGYQGAVRVSSEESSDKQRASVSKVNVEDLAKAAKAIADGGTGAIAVAAGSDASTADTEGTTLTTHLPTTNAAKGALSADKFSALLAMAAAPSEISERKALLIGVNDKITENILKYLIDPTDVPKNKKIYLAVFQVSCVPGWRTRNGYTADILVTPEYFQGKKYSLDRQKDDSFVYQPSILSVFPLLEAQTLDLRASNRHQAAIADYVASLAEGMGANEQQELLKSYVRRQERDAATRSPIPVVTSYSDGQSFGFQFRPQLQAVDDPAKEEAKSANLLYPYSLPALALILCDDDDIRPAEYKNARNKVGGDWQNIVMHVNTRWIPPKGDACFLMRPFVKRLSVVDRVGYADEFLRARTLYETWLDGRKAKSLPDGEKVDTWPSLEIRRRLRELEVLGVGKTVISPLPPYPSPEEKPSALAIADVQPRVGWRNADTVLCITGTGFMQSKTSLVKRVTVGGRDCSFETLGEKTIVAVVPKWPEVGSRMSDGCVTVATGKDMAGFAPPIVFSRCVEPSLPAPSVDVERNSAGAITKLTLHQSGDLSGEKLLAGIREILAAQGKTVTFEVSTKKE